MIVTYNSRADICETLIRIEISSYVLIIKPKSAQATRTNRKCCRFLYSAQARVELRVRLQSIVLTRRRAAVAGRYKFKFLKFRTFIEYFSNCVTFHLCLNDVKTAKCKVSQVQKP